MIGRSRRVAGILLVFIALSFQTHHLRAAETAPKTYVALWFDTEDFILPDSDDAALKIADWLTEEKIRSTFKVVGEKARVLEADEPT